VGVDRAKAAQLYAQAAAQGHAEAQLELGSCHSVGEGVELNSVKAVQLFRQAANQGFADAHFTLAFCYEIGNGVARVDKAEAARLYTQAAEQGHAEAQRHLGMCFELGKGLEQDEADAVGWYRRANDGGCCLANANLGLCVEKGRGVPRDPAEAQRLYARVADNIAASVHLFGASDEVLQNGFSKPGIVPTRAMLAIIRHAVYQANVAARMGQAPATETLEALAGRREVVPVCCAGCGAVHKLKDNNDKLHCNKLIHINLPCHGSRI
jgi:hypothetical protein